MVLELEPFCVEVFTANSITYYVAINSEKLFIFYVHQVIYV